MQSSSLLLQIYGASALSLVQRSTSVYFAEHKFDRCQTCFCLIRAASVPLLNVPAVNLCSRLVSTGRTRMSVVLCSSDVFVQQKLASRSVHGCTLLDSLFQKAYGKCVFKSGGGVCIYFVLHKIHTRRFRSGMDAADSTQKRVCLQTRSPK